MNNLNDEQIDRIIKEKFKQDTTISDKANSVFANFKPEVTNKTSVKQETIQASKNAINMLFYKRLNRVLSVAAVLLTVVLVGGTTLYFNKDKIQSNSNNQTSQNETVTYTKTYAIKNEPLNYSNEQLVKEVENGFVKAYLVGNTDVGVELKSTYWDQIGKKEIVTTETYKVEGIKDNIKDIFIGSPENSAIPYVFLVMEDYTAMFIDLTGYYHDSLYFKALKLEGLNNVVGFEEKRKNYSYSKTQYYTYVEAIRNDGFRQEISPWMVNNWNKTVVDTYDRLNEKYIKAHDGLAIPDDGRGDFEVDGVYYNTANNDSRYMYCMKGEFMHQDLYRIERGTGLETRIASGINGMSRNNPDGRISYYVDEDNYTIYELDNNIVYRHRDERIINEITNENKTNNPSIEELSDFEKRIYESGNYYYSKNRHYCIKNPKEENIAYYIEDEKLYRVIIPNNDSVESVAEGVEDIKEDSEQNLIVTLRLEGSVFGNYEGNVIFKEHSITDSTIAQTSYDENFEVLLKEDGSISILLYPGALERLGIDKNKTAISEDVYYNVYGSAYGVENTKNHFYYANAKEFSFATAGRNKRWCLVYRRDDGNVIAIDILNAIECGSFTGAKTSTIYVEEEILSLYHSEYSDDVDENGKSIPTYKTILIKVRGKDGKELTRHMYMPCEEL